MCHELLSSQRIFPLPIKFAASVKYDSAAAILALLHLMGPDPNKKPVGEGS